MPFKIHNPFRRTTSPPPAAPEIPRLRAGTPQQQRVQLLMDVVADLVSNMDITPQQHEDVAHYVQGEGSRGVAVLYRLYLDATRKRADAEKELAQLKEQVRFARLVGGELPEPAPDPAPGALRLPFEN